MTWSCPAGNILGHSKRSYQESGNINFQIISVHLIRGLSEVTETLLLPGNNKCQYINISKLIFYDKIKMGREKHNRSHIKILLFATLKTL